MRELADETRIRQFMLAVGAAAPEGDCCLTGGATAVLLGWRSTTLDVDIRLEPDQDEVRPSTSLRFGRVLTIFHASKGLFRPEGR